MKYVIVYIDGTCSDPTHRLHYIKDSPKNWDAFHAEVGGDGVHYDILDLVRAVDGNALLIYISGRMERCRSDTVHWLAVNGFPFAPLHLRADEDYRQDYIAKAEIADRLGLTAKNVWFALDDRQQVVDMWRRRGIRCLQVADGKF